MNRLALSSLLFGLLLALSAVDGRRRRMPQMGNMGGFRSRMEGLQQAASNLEMPPLGTIGRGLSMRGGVQQAASDGEVPETGGAENEGLSAYIRNPNFARPPHRRMKPTANRFRGQEASAATGDQPPSALAEDQLPSAPIGDQQHREEKPCMPLPLPAVRGRIRELITLVVTLCNGNEVESPFDEVCELAKPPALDGENQMQNSVDGEGQEINRPLSQFFGVRPEPAGADGELPFKPLPRNSDKDDVAEAASA